MVLLSRHSDLWVQSIPSIVAVQWSAENIWFTKPGEASGLVLGLAPATPTKVAMSNAPRSTGIHSLFTLLISIPFQVGLCCLEPNGLPLSFFITTYPSTDLT